MTDDLLRDPLSAVPVIQRDRGLRIDATAACEAAWIPLLFAIPNQIFLLPGRSKHRQVFVWNLWAVAQPWPEALARRRLAHRNTWANLRPLWTARIEPGPHHWRMTTWSWGAIKQRVGSFHVDVAWAISGNIHRVYAAYPPPVPEQHWVWHPDTDQWVSDTGASSWCDPDLLTDFAHWLADPQAPDVHLTLRAVFADITRPPQSRSETLARWWQRS